MPQTLITQLRSSRFRAGPLLAVFALAAAFSVPRVNADQRDGAEPFPQEDAVFLRFAQHWTLERDGSTRYREQWAVKLRNNRPLDRFADPRISHLRDDDKVILHEAQTVLPDGSTLEVPDYGRNYAASDALAGWPLYAGWQDLIVSFSGIEAGVVLKLDYEVVSPAGTSPWLDGLVRLNDEFPVVERLVSVSVPDGTPLHHRLTRAQEAKFALEEKKSDGMHTFRWSAMNVAGQRDEPQALPWVMRSAGLKFTTCANPTAWATTLLSVVDRAAAAHSNVEAFARAAVEKENVPVEQVRKIAAKLRETFNVVESPKALRRLTCRDAQEVLHSNYGNELEAGALLLAALRAHGSKAMAMVAVKPDEWTASDEIAPALASFDGVVVQVSLPRETLHFHPRHGEIKNPGSWGRRTLLVVSDGRLETGYVETRGERSGSNLEVTGKLALAKDGTARGELRLAASGAYFDPAKLQTSDEQKAWATGVAGQILSGLEVSTVTIGTLSEDELHMTVQVASAGSLPKAGDRVVVRLGDGPSLPQGIALPLERSERAGDLRVGSRLSELVDVTVEIPTEFKKVVPPMTFEPISGSWGSAAQRAQLQDGSFRFTRSLTIEKSTLSASEFLALRDVVNTLRATRYLTMSVAP